MKERRKTTELVGLKYGRLLVVSTFVHKTKGWVVARCDCGNERRVSVANLGRGTLSCGCLIREIMSKNAFKRVGKGNGRHKHDGNGTRLYEIWTGMKKRCLNPNNKNYHRYGGRGIGVCSDWLEFMSFKEWAMASGYADNLTIERIDNNRGYEPSNCKWATREEQNNNTSQCVYVEHNGERLTVTQMARKYKISYSLFRSRIIRGWSIERALDTPNQRG